MTQKTETPTRIISPLAILSYPHLHEPQAGQDGKKPQYSAALVFTPELLALPGEQEKFQTMEAALIFVGQKKFGDKFAAQLQSESFKKGFRRDGEAKGYGKGSIYVNVRNAEQPGFVYSWPESGTTKPARVPQEKVREVFYAGSIVRASLSAFAFNRPDSKGLSFALNNLQWIKDGPRLDNRKAADEDFAADLSQAPADLASLGL